MKFLAVLASALALLVACSQPTTASDPPTELVTNGDFALEDQDWTSWQASNPPAVATYTGGQFTLPAGESRGSEVWSWQLMSTGKTFVVGKTYTLTFDASSTVAESIKVEICQSGDPYTTFHEQTFSLTSSLESYTVTWTYTGKVDGLTVTPGADQLLFDLGNTTGTLVLDNVSLVAH